MKKEKKNKTQSFVADLERCWLRQLSVEHRNLCLQYGVKLRSPTFELSDSMTALGSWCQERRRIQISRHLIRENPWFITLQVLKHEMAHQLASELSGLEHPPHGKVFRQACELLGVLPQFRTPHCLDHQVVGRSWRGLPEKEDRNVQRVKKLLALAESGNEHEAALALEKARELIQRYQVETLTAGDEVEYTCRIIDGKRKRLARYQHHICSLLSEFFLVRCVIAEQYDPERDDLFRVVEMFGTRENVRIAEYCWFFLENHLRIQWRRRQKTVIGHAGRHRNSFLLGMVQGFSAKLGAGIKFRSTESQEPNQAVQLQCLAIRSMDNYLAFYHPRLRKQRSSVIRVYTDSYHEGIEAGNSLEFSQGIEHGKNSFGGFLGE